MKILLLGADGYYGYPLLVNLSKNYDVLGLDNFSRRNEVDYPNLMPYGNRNINFCDITNIDELTRYIKYFLPDIVIHLAEQRSAPFSMINSHNRSYTLKNNFLGTLNILECAKQFNFKIIHIGSMGMYGYENEKLVTEEDKIRNPGSAYHLTKEIDASLFAFYSKMYNIDIVDLIQGTVWGIGGRYDYDHVYGTIINRFILQNMLNLPLTVYGKGTQQRSFIHIDNSIDCVNFILNTNFNGYTMYNQFTEILTINEIANIIGGETVNLCNPRIEEDDNHFCSINSKIMELGLIVKHLDKIQIEYIKDCISPYLKLVNKDLIYPNGKWK